MRTSAPKTKQPRKSVRSSLALDKEAAGPSHREHPLLDLQSKIGNRAVLRRLSAPLQRQPAGAGSAPTRQQEITEFEAGRARFEQGQEEHFESIGEAIREHLLKAAGFVDGKRPSTPDEALQVVGMWGVTLQMLTTQLPNLTQSLSGQVTGQHASSTMAQQQQTLIAAMTPQGQQTFQQMLTTVQREPFWNQHLATQDIFIFPDLTGTNRYNGYTQRGSGQTPEGITKPVFIIHISKDRLEAGQVQESVATLIHELSHTLYEPNILKRSLSSFTSSLSTLLADHPTIAALRQGAQDPVAAQQTHIQRISQILYERTGYNEAEIFVHLQQLTHQPAVPAGGGQSISGSRFILEAVDGYVKKLQAIGLPPRIMSGILRKLADRTALLYDRRIAAAPQGSSQRRLLVLNKEQALAILGIAGSL